MDDKRISSVSRSTYKSNIERLNQRLLDKTEALAKTQDSLLKVTEEEASLVFEPQIILVYRDTMFTIENLGKSTVCVLGIYIEGGERITYDEPQCLIPKARMTFYPKDFEDSARRIIGLNGRKEYISQLLIKNQRNEYYKSEWLLQIFMSEGKATINTSGNHTYRIKRSEW